MSAQTAGEGTTGGTAAGSAPATGHATVLLIDHDQAIAALLADVLHARGYRVEHVQRAAAARAALRDRVPDLIILNLVLPDADGLVLCGELRARPDLAGVPIVVCSARDRTVDRVVALNCGADYFIAQPFDVDEVEARIRAALRHHGRAAGNAAPAGEQPLHVGNLRIDPGRWQAALAGRSLRLTPTEFRILCALARRPGQVVSRQDLAREVWGDHERHGIDRSLGVHVTRLRDKLAAGDAPAPAIVAIRGVGYALTTEPQGIPSSAA